MKGFVEQLMLAEKAAEDIYFQRVNRELIEALHRQKLPVGADAGRPAADKVPGQGPAQERLS
ncbi:MAG: hypothetical protein PVF07_09765 [Thiogranum sp.]|jgi:hypothetical protein